MKPTPRQERFCLAYVETLNATEAARRAGYPHPNKQGPRLLKSPAVRALLQQTMAEASEKVGITAEWVLSELVDAVQVAKASVKPKLNTRTGKPIKDDEGNPVYTRNDAALLRALELIGKHISVVAFDNSFRMAVSVEEDLINRINRGRDRIAAGAHDQPKIDYER